MSFQSYCDEFGFSLEEIHATAAAGRLLTMEIEFSQLCNFNCPYCYVEPRHEEELTSEEYRDVIRQARELGAKTLIILGGEPMIYPRILDKIRFIRQQGMGVDIFTNGSNMTMDNAREMAALDVRVVLKLNSLDRQKQNRLCGMPNAHQIIHDALHHLQKAGYGEGGRKMAVSSVICRDNVDEMPSLWRWLRRQKIEPYVEMITPQGSARENDGLQVDTERVRRLFEEIQAIDRDEFGRIWEVQPPLVGNRCLRHQFSCYVNAYGDVMPCVGVDIRVGNVRQRKLAEILRDSEVFEDLRNYRKTIKGPCGSCERKDVCYGCRGAAYQMTGDYLGSDPLCWNLTRQQGEIDRLPMSVEGLIPQSSPMRMVNRILSVGERSAEIESVLDAGNPFLDANGALEPAAFLEVIAQAAAAHHGFRSRNLPGRPEGFLLGAKALKISGQARVGDRLRVAVFKEARLGAFGVIRGEVFLKNQRIAEGEIKVFHKEAVVES
ncbi:MAG: radical SAM protein [Kiritimatiellia bacterium]|nr:radical SAM protein [Kiritimatiellia bacterium]